jgi:hypothetical protein
MRVKLSWHRHIQLPFAKNAKDGTECDDASKIKSLGPHPIRIISSHLTSHCRSIMSYDFSVICKVVRREGMCTLTNDLA